MKPLLETILPRNENQSFLYYKVEVPTFAPFWHYHPAIELTYIERGTGLRFVGDHMAPFEPGDLVLVGENLPHHWVADSAPNGGCSAYVMQFSAHLLSSFPEMALAQSMTAEARYGLRFATKAIQPQIKAMENLLAFERLLAFLSILQQLANTEGQRLSTISYQQNTQLKRHQSRITEVTTYLLNHLQQPLSLNLLAEQQHMTTSSFSRWFKQSLGKSFVEYLQLLRVEKACQLLLHSDFPVAQIAFQVGFESLSNFNRTFKKGKGVSPREYRLLGQQSKTG